MKKLLFIFSLVVLLQSKSLGQILSNEDKASTYKYALEMYNDSKFNTAIEFCTKILISDRDLETLKLRAMAYRANDDYYNAANDYSEAIQVQARYGKRDPSLFFNRAKVNICLKKFKEALIDLNEARRIFRDAGNENFIYQEEIGRMYHYLGDNKSAVTFLKDAIKNGSSSAYIDLLSSLLQIGYLQDIKTYSDTLLTGEQPGFMADSMFYYYLRTLNDIGNGAANAYSLEKIDQGLKYYHTSNKQCFQGLYYDMLNARAYTRSILGYDSLAYLDYREIFLNNDNLVEIKNKIDYLKNKLGMDVSGPVIALKIPQVNIDQKATLSAAKGRFSIIGQVTDSSGIANVTINCNERNYIIPLSSIESDGLFEAKIELQSDINKLVILATDKNDNPSEKTYYINFNETGPSAKGVRDSLSDDEIPEINAAVNYYALLIGEKDYVDEGFNDLETPLNDANGLKDVLVRQYGFGEKNVKLLANASRTEIVDTLDKICRMMTDADNLLVFYAGHGDVKRVNNRIEGGYIIPTDAKKGNRGSYINSEDLLEPVGNSAARHILFIVDACFGGALMRSAIDEAPQSMKNLYNNRSRRILTSGNLEEVPDHGKFISNLLKFLQTPGSKYFSDQDLYTYIQNNNNSTAVTPLFERIKNSGDAGGGQFIFVNNDYH